MFSQMTFEGMYNATSSQVSAGGVTRSVLPDGQMTARHGQEVALASRFLPLEGEKEQQTSVISGQNFSDLSGSAALQSFFGEQVASKDALSWLDAVCADLEGAGYAAGAADLCAAGVGAPHIRQRLYWCALKPEDTGDYYIPVADPNSTGQLPWERNHPPMGYWEAVAAGSISGQSVADSAGLEHQRGLPEFRETGSQKTKRPPEVVAGFCTTGGMGHPDNAGLERRRGSQCADELHTWARMLENFWGSAGWIACRDNKCRPAQPGIFPLAYGVPNRVVKLRGYGNAIVPQVAQVFIETVMEGL